MQQPVKRHRRSVDYSAFLSIFLLIVLPPVGIALIWRRRWHTAVKISLTGIVIAGLMVAFFLIPSADNVVRGNIELVGSEKQAGVYGPSLPTAMVTGAARENASSVLVDVDAVVEPHYVYAATGAECYHESNCKFAYASSQKITVYEAYYLGYKPCGRCNPPTYTPGSATAVEQPEG